MRLLFLLLLIPMIAVADAPKAKVPFKYKAPKEPTVVAHEIDTALGKVTANLYVMFNPGEGERMLAAREWPVPEKYAKSKPEEIYALLEKELADNKTFEKSAAIKIGKDPARDVLCIDKPIDAETGKTYTRMRWVVHGGRVYEFSAMWFENRAGSKDWVKKTGNPFIESIAFP